MKHLHGHRSIYHISDYIHAGKNEAILLFLTFHVVIKAKALVHQPQPALKASLMHTWLRIFITICICIKMVVNSKHTPEHCDRCNFTYLLTTEWTRNSTTERLLDIPFAWHCVSLITSFKLTSGGYLYKFDNLESQSVIMVFIVPPNKKTFLSAEVRATQAELEWKKSPVVPSCFSPSTSKPINSAHESRLSPSSFYEETTAKRKIINQLERANWNTDPSVLSNLIW